jgi:hypothetical protein
MCCAKGKHENIKMGKYKKRRPKNLRINCSYS